MRMRSIAIGGALLLLPLAAWILAYALLMRSSAPGTSGGVGGP